LSLSPVFTEPGPFYTTRKHVDNGHLSVKTGATVTDHRRLSLSNKPSFRILLYCSGISVSAASATAACGFRAPVFTAWKSTKLKLSNLRAGRCSSNSFMTSHGPSPTPASETTTFVYPFWRTTFYVFTYLGSR